MYKKNKSVEVYKDGVLLGVFTSIIEAIYEYRISYHSIQKSINEGSYIKGYLFKFPKVEG